MSRDDDYEERNEGVDIVVRDVIRMTGKAALCKIDDKTETREVWLPLSQLKDGSDEVDEGCGKIVLVIPRWLAEEKNLA